MPPSDSRRDFLRASAATLAALATTACNHPAHPAASEAPAGTPPAFGTGPTFGPPVSADDFTHAEKLVEVTLSDAERQQAAGNWQQSMAPLLERRTGPRRVDLPPSLAPYAISDPVLAANSSGAPPLSPTGQPNRFVRSPASTVPPLPATDEAIAFSPVSHLSRWIESRQLSSERLTRIYLARLQRFNPTLRCVITLTPDHALDQARRADAEIAAGHYRGPLHGIPWGAKDLLDTAGIPTTYGAEPFQHRVPTTDATVTQRLNDAGAVLVAKLSLGALALNDVWFGGQTMNPWLPSVEGASGSSAGPGAATAAGLVGFSIGSETGGSIVSPSMRCGVTGLRPTFGRVPRSGAMTLCWSLDKLGPMCRSVEDTLLVLQAISGPEALNNPAGFDPSCIPSTLNVDLTRSARGLKLGYFPQWMSASPATDVDRHALEVARSLGFTLVPLTLPDWPYSSLQLLLFAEAAASFEDLTLSHHDRDLKMQVPDAWPNSFRQARFLSAVDFVQADRLRRKVATMMAHLFAGTLHEGVIPTEAQRSGGSHFSADTLQEGVIPTGATRSGGTRFSSPDSHSGVSPTEAKRSGATRFAPATAAQQNPNAPDLLLVPSLRDEMLTITNHTGHPSLTLPAGFVTITEPRSDWAPDPQHPAPKLPQPTQVPYGITLIGRLFDEGTLATAGHALQTAFNMTPHHPPGF